VSSRAPIKSRAMLEVTVYAGVVTQFCPSSRPTPRRMTWLRTIRTAAVTLSVPAGRLRGESAIEDLPWVDRHSGRLLPSQRSVGTGTNRGGRTVREGIRDFLAGKSVVSPGSVWPAPPGEGSDTYPDTQDASRLLR
jgi:hypothetical protein